MDSGATRAMRRASLLLIAAVAAGCGGALSAKGGADAAGGTGGTGTGGGAGGSTAACCPGGGQIIASVVHAHGFTAYEGRSVKAVFLYSSAAIPNGITNLETFVSGGAFDFDFSISGGTCSDGGSVNGAAAIYIDGDGD